MPRNPPVASEDNMPPTGPVESDFEARFALGMQLKRSCRYEDAIREFKAVTALAQDFSTGHYELGKTYLLTGNNAEAIKEFGLTARFEPDSMDPQFFLRYVPRFTKPLDEELKDAQTAVDAATGAAETHNRLGVILIMVDNLDCGMQEIQWAVELEPNNAEYHLNLGYAESFLDEGEATLEVKEALRRKPKWLDAWLMLGALYMDTTRILDAIHAYKKAIKLYPDNDLLHYLLGDAYFKSDRVREARKEMKKAIKLNPDNYAARSVLVSMYLMEDLKDEAMEQLEELVRMEPGVKMARDKLQ